MIQILAPCPGRIFPITEVSDPVFAQQIVGPGIAMEPAPARTTVLSPVAGTLVKLHPHAFAIATSDGTGILVHLGIDTVKLNGEGFELLTSEGSTLSAGDPIVTWNPADISRKGMDATVVVVVLDRPDATLTRPTEQNNIQVQAGEVLLNVA